MNKIDALIDFICDPEKDIEEMTPEAVREYLRENGIDPDEAKGELQRRMADIDAKRQQLREFMVEQVVRKEANP